MPPPDDGDQRRHDEKAEKGGDPAVPRRGKPSEQESQAETEKSADRRADFIRPEPSGNRDSAEDPAEQSENNQNKPHVN